MTKVAGSPDNADEMAGGVVSDSGPWAMVPVWVLSLGLAGAELAVYVALRSFADRRGDAYPHVKTIAARAGVSVRTASRAIARFRELGLVRTTQRHRADGGVAGCSYVLRDTPLTGMTGGPLTGVTGQEHTKLEQTKEPAVAGAPDGPARPSRQRRRGKPSKPETLDADSLLMAQTPDEAAADHEREQAAARIGLDGVEGVETACAVAGVALTPSEKRCLYVLLARQSPDVRSEALYRLENWSRPDRVTKPRPMMVRRVEVAIEQARKAVA